MKVAAGNSAEHDLFGGRGHRHYLGRHLFARQPGARERLPGCGTSRWQHCPCAGRIYPPRRPGIRQCAVGTTAGLPARSAAFRPRAWVARNKSHNALTVQFGIVDAAGFVVQSSFRRGVAGLCRRSRAIYGTAGWKDRRALYQRSDHRPCDQAADAPICPPRDQSRWLVRRGGGQLARHRGTGEVLQLARPRQIGDCVAGRRGWDSSGARRSGSGEPRDGGFSHSLLFSHLAHSTAGNYWNNRREPGGSTVSAG